MSITKSSAQLVQEATAQITTYTVAQVRERLTDPNIQVVDIRDVRELEREGTVPGALLAPTATATEFVRTYASIADRS